ncbi:MAG: hypothetical protein U9N14_03620 [Pseudomonadota bacterium]|nr:hypothetical protein [Pseudomonadota bacterium]
MPRKPMVAAQAGGLAWELSLGVLAAVSRVSFRPVLACRLVSRFDTVDEHAAEVGWSLVLEEV